MMDGVQQDRSRDGSQPGVGTAAGAIAGAQEAVVDRVDQAGADSHASVESPTGHPAVDAAVQAIQGASHAPPADQIPTYQAAHRTLRETLTSIDES